jgi:pilus assembly protein FimV
MRLRVLSTAATLLATMPGTSLALGLGEVQLKSTLNAPLNAEIELVANPEELGSLRAQLASRESFSRYGLEYPAFLSGIQVRTVVLPDGRNVIRLTSTAAMTEPFATLLVEAAWARGRIQREYTLLFDPPAFAPVQGAAAPIVAPAGGAGERSGAVARAAAPAAQPAPAPAAAPATAAPAAGGGGDYQVRGGDSLSGIARREYGLGEADRGMIAIYRANPGAFGGNINNLRAGAVLRLPEDSALNSIDRAEASSEVRRQAAAWAQAAAAAATPAAPATAAGEARLRLVPPGGAPAPAGAGTGTGNAAASAESAQLRDRVTQLESELAESRRLLELRNAELARLQGQGAAPATEAPAPGAPPPAATATPPADTATSAQAAPPPAPAAAPAAKPAAPAAPAEPTLVERLRAFWYVPAGLLLLLLAALGLRTARRRREAAEFASFAPSSEPAFEDLEPAVDTGTFPIRKRGDRDPSIVVEETGSHRALEEGPDTHTIDLGEGIDTATSMTMPALSPDAGFGQGDPLAEADFHMAYGLYDQAADLVKLAIEREPARRDLKLKLVEVFFVWGNKDQFLQAARELAATREGAAPGEWEKVVIMGKQLAPEDPLFSKSVASAGGAGVDLNLEGGQNLVDFDLPSDTGLGLHTPAAAPDDEIGSLDFILDDHAGGDLDRTATTRQFVQPGLSSAESTQRVDLAPTVEQPRPGMGDLLTEKLDAHAAHLGSDQTAELALDDLGLDLGRFESTGTGLEDTGLTRALEIGGHGSDATSQESTLVAAFSDPQGGDLLAGADATEMLPLADLDLPNSATTSLVSALDLNLDLDGNAETGKRQAPQFGIDLDVGSSRAPADVGHQATQQLEPVVFDDDDEGTLVSLEPVTMSEVGTKLDLARAYMDMGDPDGARSILGEVLQEGTSAQKLEAQRLLDSIPG